MLLRRTRHLASSVTLLMCLGACAQSQPPTPGGLEPNGSQPNEQAQSAQGQSGVLIGTESNPAIVTVTKSKEEAAQEQADREREATTQRWIIGNGVVMALLTLALIVVGALQWKTYEAARKTTHTLERARFSIENRKIQLLEENRRLRIEFEAMNRGRSVATITRTAYHLYVMPSLPQPPVFPPWTEEPEVVQAGEATVFELILRFDTASQFREVATKTSFLFVIGRIEYTDVFDKTHERGFVFVYDVDAETFHPPKDASGYNYET